MAKRQLTAKITYRLDQGTFDQLTEMGQKVGLTPHAMARQLMVDSLDKSETDSLRQDILELHQEQMTRFSEAIRQMGQLRLDLATAVEAILVNISDETPDEVREWVIETLLKADLPAESFPE